jgi:hypothetical protein
MLLVTLLLVMLGPLAVQLLGMASLVSTMALLTVPISGDLSSCCSLLLHLWLPLLLLEAHPRGCSCCSLLLHLLLPRVLLPLGRLLSNLSLTSLCLRIIFCSFCCLFLFQVILLLLRFCRSVAPVMVLAGWVDQQTGGPTAGAGGPLLLHQ